MNGLTNCGTSRQWNIIQSLESSQEMTHRNLKCIITNGRRQFEKPTYQGKTMVNKEMSSFQGLAGGRDEHVEFCRRFLKQ